MALLHMDELSQTSLGRRVSSMVGPTQYNHKETIISSGLASCGGHTVPSPERRTSRDTANLGLVPSVKTTQRVPECLLQL